MLFRSDTAGLARRAANFEQIRKIVIEKNGEAQIDWTAAMIADLESLIDRALPQKDCSQDVQHVLLKRETLLDVDVRICQIDRHQRVVVSDVRSKQQGLLAIQQKFQAREKPGVVVEQTVGPARRCADITMRVDQDECIAVLE